MTHERDRFWQVSLDMLGVATDEGVWESVNPAWTHILGWSESEIVGRTSEWLEHPDDSAKTRAQIGRLREGEPTLAFENRFRSKSGQYHLLSWRATPDRGHIFTVAWDITLEREREIALEAQFRQSQKMESLGQLTGGIAHDFNNLLQGIVGSIGVARALAGAGRAGEIGRYLDIANRSTQRAAALTHRLLAFSRRQPLNPRPLDVNALIAGTEDLLRRTLGEHIDLELVLAGGLWPIRCDSNQLENALLSLVINARDAMPDGGKLTVETSNAYLDHAYAATHVDVLPGQYVCAAVSDTGTGMSARTLERAFDPFFTTKPIGQGAGLGLSMIYGFARQSEGHAQICSELGRGTSVRIYIPRHRGEVEAPTAQLAAESIELQATRIILVVEDEPVIRELIVGVLEGHGYRTLQAADGGAAGRILRSTQPIDLIVTDVGLPVLNGRQVADIARETRKDIKILFMTGYSENTALGDFLEAGMELITKPFPMDTLSQRVGDMLAGAGRIPLRKER